MAYPLDLHDGRAGAAEPEKPVQVSATMNLNLTEQQYTDLLRDGLFLHPQIPLKGGRYVVRLGVLDTGSGRIGTLNLPLRMPGEPAR